MSIKPNQVCPGWFWAVALLALLSGPSFRFVQAADFTGYHNYQGLSGALRELAAAYPDLARMESIGKTAQGRDLWVLEIGNRAGAPVDQRPGLLVAGNFEGDHLIGSELALNAAHYFLSSYAGDAAVRKCLDEFVIYIIPRVNPDGAEPMFAGAKTGIRTNLAPVDADNDGRLDENGPEDLNRDGFITQMRVKDPKGPYRVSSEDGRLMKRADPSKGESGGYAIYREGVDADKDGFVAEDGPGGTDINRNFMHQYPYYQADSGRYMASENETRAMLDYVLKHRNIAAVLAFGISDNLIVSPNQRGESGAPNAVDLLQFADQSVGDARKVGLFAESLGGAGRGQAPAGAAEAAAGRSGSPTAAAARGTQARQPATTVNAADLEYFTAIGNKYRDLTGIRSAGFTRAPAGAFFEYGYYQYGVPSFSTPGWGLPAAAAGPNSQAAAGRATGEAAAEIVRGARPEAAGPQGRGPASGSETGGAAARSLDLRLLQWMDSEKIDGFVPWAPFAHPTLGQVEIGGFKPYAITNPPASAIPQLAEAHSRFALYLTSLFSRISIARAESVALGGGVYRIEAEIENTGFLPTALAHAVTARAVKPVMVQLEVPTESIITGNEKTNQISSLAGSGSRQSYQWVIRGKPGSTVTLNVISQKSGTATVALKLQ